MKLHERTQPVQRATIACRLAFWEAVKDGDLTMIEAAQAAAEIAQDALRYALREERHGDASHKADEA